MPPIPLTVTRTVAGVILARGGDPVCRLWRTDAIVWYAGTDNRPQPIAVCQSRRDAMRKLNEQIGAYLVRKAGSKDAGRPEYLRGNHWTPLKSWASVYTAQQCREMCDQHGGVPEILYLAADPCEAWRLLDELLRKGAEYGSPIPNRISRDYRRPKPKGSPNQ